MPSLPTLPGLGDHLAAAAEELCHLARWWLAREGEAVLGVGDDDGRLALMAWSHSLEGRPVAPGAAPRLARKARSPLGLILTDLRVRWPSGLEPHRLALVTDGSGVAFAPERPWLLDMPWLVRQAQAPDVLVAIRRFSPNGALALLTKAAGDPTLH